MLRDSLPEIKTECLPGPKAQAVIDRRAAAIPSGIRCGYPVVMDHAEGAMIEDVDGNRFLDWRCWCFEYRSLSSGSGGSSEESGR